MVDDQIHYNAKPKVSHQSSPVELTLLSSFEMGFLYLRAVAGFNDNLSQISNEWTVSITVLIVSVDVKEATLSMCSISGNRQGGGEGSAERLPLAAAAVFAETQTSISKLPLLAEGQGLSRNLSGVQELLQHRAWWADYLPGCSFFYSGSRGNQPQGWNGYWGFSSSGVRQLLLL